MCTRYTSCLKFPGVPARKQCAHMQYTSLSPSLVMSPKDADRMANSVDPDRTAPEANSVEPDQTEPSV